MKLSSTVRYSTPYCSVCSGIVSSGQRDDFEAVFRAITRVGVSKHDPRIDEQHRQPVSVDDARWHTTDPGRCIADKIAT
jgi:hypothetical protein